MSSDFDFESGDTVLVRIREDGQLVAKFIATIKSFHSPRMRPDIVRVRTSWNGIGTLKLHSYEADFEPVEDPEEVNF